MKKQNYVLAGFVVVLLALSFSLFLEYRVQQDEERELIRLETTSRNLSDRINQMVKSRS